jgi:hypothetical protein
LIALLVVTAAPIVIAAQRPPPRWSRASRGFNTSMRVTALQTLLEERFMLKIRDMTQDADNPMNDVLTLVVDRSDGTLGRR